MRAPRARRTNEDSGPGARTEFHAAVRSGRDVVALAGSTRSPRRAPAPGGLLPAGAPERREPGGPRRRGRAARLAPPRGRSPRRVGAPRPARPWTTALAAGEATAWAPRWGAAPGTARRPPRPWPGGGLRLRGRLRLGLRRPLGGRLSTLLVGLGLGGPGRLVLRAALGDGVGQARQDDVDRPHGVVVGRDRDVDESVSSTPRRIRAAKMASPLRTALGEKRLRKRRSEPFGSLSAIPHLWNASSRSRLSCGFSVLDLCVVRVCSRAWRRRRNWRSRTRCSGVG